MIRLRIFLLFSITVLSCCSERPTLDSPNILFILADDLGYGDLGCYGQETILTPNIDKLAGEGMRFIQHYAGNTVCAPSRCALMTGFHMGNAEVRNNQRILPSGDWALSEGAVTVAELLGSAGYRTAMIGKWGLGIESSTGDPMAQGFDLYYGYLDQVLAHNYYPEYLLRNREREYLPNEVHYLDTSLWHRGLGSYSTKKVQYSHDLFVEESLRYLEEIRTQPFFLYLPFTIPHNNGEERPGEKQEVPDLEPYSDRDWPKETMGYAAMITRLDKGVGRILDKLVELGLKENTIVFFTSDNGPMPDMEFTGFFNSNGQYRGGKTDLYDGGIRVPMIVRWPGKIREGTISNHVSAFWDFLPTACELAGLEIPDKTDGISFLPELLGNEQPEHEYLYWEFNKKGGKQAIRMGHWKLLRNGFFMEPEGLPELYNLFSDPGEEKDLSSEFPDTLRKLLAEIDKVRTESESFPFYTMK